jgi:hypothetical protein
LHSLSDSVGYRRDAYSTAQEKFMGIADKLKNDDLQARRTRTISRLVMAATGLALLLFLLFYFLLPWWRGSPQ